MMNNKANLVGKKFGRLTVLCDSRRRDSSNNVYWLCRCSCGNFSSVSGYNLKKGRTKSCGCFRREHMLMIRKNPPIKHGDAGGKEKKPARLYQIWIDMKNRCYDSNQHGYKWYGGKGITICNEWKNNYIVFRGWALINGYENTLTIDRLNSDGNYEPSNCQWLGRIAHTIKDHLGKKYNKNKEKK